MERVCWTWVLKKCCSWQTLGEGQDENDKEKGIIGNESVDGKFRKDVMMPS